MKTQQTAVILAVVTLLGVLVADIRSNTVICILDDSPAAKAISDIRTIEAALHLYRLDNFRYPTAEQGLTALVTRPDGPDLENWKTDGYIARLPKDPWGNNYRYASPGRHGEIDVYTLGRDGRAGGTGIDDTIGNWNPGDRNPFR